MATRPGQDRPAKAARRQRRVAHLKWHPGPREHSDGEAGTRDECSAETGSLAAPGNGAVIAVAAGEPLFRVPPARRTSDLCAMGS